MKHRSIGLTGVAAVAATALLAACGPSSATSGKDPNQVVRQAVAQLQGTSAHMHVDGSLGVTSSGIENLPAKAREALAKIGHGGSGSADIDQQSSTQRRITSGHDVIVENGSTVAFSKDSGKTFTDESGKIPAKAQAAHLDIGAVVGAFSFGDKGSDTQDGQQAEHYQAPVDAATLQRLGSLQISGETDQVRQIIAFVLPFITVKHGTLDAWVNSAGTLVRMTLDTELFVDLSAVGSLGSTASAVPSATPSGSGGSLDLVIKADLHVKDVGSSISVTTPPSMAPASAKPAEGSPSASPAGATP